MDHLKQAHEDVHDFVVEPGARLQARQQVTGDADIGALVEQDLSLLVGCLLLQWARTSPHHQANHLAAGDGPSTC